MEKQATWNENIKNHTRAYKNLMMYCQTLNVKCNVTPKLYGLWVHEPQFLDHQEAKGHDHGLAWWAEQVFEARHNDFEQFEIRHS